MKTVYFIFNSMKEAEYNFKTLKFYLPSDYTGVKSSRNPYTIIMPRLKKINFIKKIFDKDTSLKIIFKSKKSDLVGIKDDIVYFDENERDYLDLIETIRKI